MQMGKAAPVDPYMMAVVGPGILTTVGAVDNFDKTKTYQTLVERLQNNSSSRCSAPAMSFGMGVGAKKRYLKPEDFVGRKVRSMESRREPGARGVEGQSGGDGVQRGADRARIRGDRRPDDEYRRLARWPASSHPTTPPAARACSPATTMISASRRWWDRLNPAQQKAIEELVSETIQLQKG